MTVQHNCFLLSVPPRITGPKEEEVSVTEGHMASLLCDVQAYPRPEITWTKDGQVLHFSTSIHILPGEPSIPRSFSQVESNSVTDIIFHIII